MIAGGGGYYIGGFGAYGGLAGGLVAVGSASISTMSALSVLVGGTNASSSFNSVTATAGGSNNGNNGGSNASYGGGAGATYGYDNATYAR